MRKIISPLLHPLFAIALSLIVGALVITLTGGNPIQVYTAMYRGAFGSTFHLLATLTRATPIIICGLGAAICWRSGYMGIGGEGQMIMGGFFCAITALHFPGPPAAKFMAAFIAAIFAGALYSAFSAWLLDKFKMSLAISTLMLNYAARYITMHYTANVFQDLSGDIKIIHTPQIVQALRLPRFVATHSLHYGFAFAIFLVCLVWFIMNRTNFGYESKMTGFNINFCNYGGVNGKKIMYLTLAFGGAVCALAGAGEVFGLQYRYVHDNYVSASYAWIGLNAALISNFNPAGVLASAVILAGVQTGGSSIARSINMPIEISAIVQGCITLFISAKIFIQWRRAKK
jgi:simple sugar transport system permease protein